jgi:hypothetical protein
LKLWNLETRLSRLKLWNKCQRHMKQAA